MNRRRANTIVAGLLASIIASIGISEAQEPTKEDALQKAAELAAERDRTEEALIAIVQSAGEDEAALKQKKKAVELLGQIGTSKAVPVLINVLPFEFDGIEISDHDDVGHIPPTPAMKALAALGPLSVEPLVNFLAQSPEDFLVRQTLGMLSCKELVAAVLADRIRQTKDEKVREKLEGAYILEVDGVLRKSRDEKERAIKNTKGQ